MNKLETAMILRDVANSTGDDISVFVERYRKALENHEKEDHKS